MPGPILVAKIGPAGPIFFPDQIFRDRLQEYSSWLENSAALGRNFVYIKFIV